MRPGSATTTPRPASGGIVRPLSRQGQNTMTLLPDLAKSPVGNPKVETTPTSLKDVADEIVEDECDTSDLVQEDSGCMGGASEENHRSPSPPTRVTPSYVLVEPTPPPRLSPPVPPETVPPLKWMPSTMAAALRASLLMKPQDYQVSKIEVLGKGAFGCVSRALDRETNRIFVVKEIPLCRDHGSEGFTNAEIEVLGSLEHPNVIKLMGFRQTESLLEIFMEYVSGGNISSVIRSFGVLTEVQTRNYTAQILDGLVYLHSRNVIHRDLKGDNILVEVDGRVKLADFGTAKKTQSVAKTVTGTTSFMAPEIIKGTGYDKSVDIWSLGCCVLEMITGKPPFADSPNPYAAMFQIASMTSTETLIPSDRGLSPSLVDFLQQCLRLEPKTRPPARELRAHGWFTAAASNKQ